jgi:hypothetical protein
MKVTKWILAGLAVLGMLALLRWVNTPRKIGYPEVRVTTPVGRAGVCHQCGKNIALVGPEHLLNAKSAQYVVCGQQCAEQMLNWHKSQFGQ